MKNLYKRISRSTIITILILTSCVFLTSLSFRVPDTPEEPLVLESETQEQPLVTPSDGAVSDETVPEEPVIASRPWASAHFLMDEYACDCAGYCDGWPTEMNPELLERIEALRMACGRPVIITSGVRCAARNAEVGGVAWSFHKKGLAADLYCPGMGVGDLAERAQETGLNILPYYSSGYIHVELPLS